MQVSYNILNRGQTEYFKRLINQIMARRFAGSDEICVVFDKEGCDENIAFLDEIHKNYPLEVRYIIRDMDYNEAEQRNANAGMASKKWIFMVDTDEQLKPFHMGGQLHEFLWQCKINGIDMVFLPRINIIPGIELVHKDWEAKKNEKGWFDFPNYTPRIYRNNGIIKWQGYMFSHLIGYTRSYKVIADEDHAILHHKTLEEQEKAGVLYRKIREVALERGWKE